MANKIDNIEQNKPVFGGIKTQTLEEDVKDILELLHEVLDRLDEQEIRRLNG